MVQASPLALPREDVLQEFLADAGWGEALVTRLAGDASFRQYSRLQEGDKTAILMDAPPPQEDVRPFVQVAVFLAEQGFSVPQVIAENVEHGFLLLEDFGDVCITKILRGEVEEPVPEREALYTLAIDAIAALQNAPAPETIGHYDNARLMAEVNALAEWYVPFIQKKTAPQAVPEEYRQLWQAVLEQTHTLPERFVYLDYHVDNLMWLPEREGIQKIGMLDFQDAALGSPAYDVVSLLQDARVDVDSALTEAMLERYFAQQPEIDRAQFMTEYALLGAQRNCKILGYFTRFALRDGKPRYLRHMPRVWRYLEEDLAHPALTEIKRWLDEAVPQEVRHQVPELAPEAHA